MTEYREINYSGHDGLMLYARDYPAKDADSALTLLCMHGLTRNSADFDDFCAVFAGQYRIISVDQRGRGKSSYDPNPANYNPMVYVQDMFALLESLEVTQVVLVGTSMGGIMSMMMTAMQPAMIQGVIMNDIGPEICAEGLIRIQGYVGNCQPKASWEDAVAHTKSINQSAFPLLDDDAWLKFAKRLYREDDHGKLHLAYDPAIAVPIKESQGKSLSLDLWPAFDAMKGKPLLVIRGELSDILTAEGAQKMQQSDPKIHYIEVANVGHAPLLNEPEVVTATTTF